MRVNSNYFAADMRSVCVCVNVYAELTNVYSFGQYRKFILYIILCLKRLVKLAYSQHIIKYMTPRLVFCESFAIANATRVYENEKKLTTAWLELILLFPSGLHFVSKIITRIH